MRDSHFRIFPWKRATKSWQVRFSLRPSLPLSLSSYPRNEIPPGAVSYMKETARPLCEKRVGTADDTERSMIVYEGVLPTSKQKRKKATRVLCKLHVTGVLRSSNGQEPS